MKVAERWELAPIPVRARWSEGKNTEGLPMVITAMLDQQIDEALAMIKKNGRCIFDMALAPSALAGNNLLHVLAHRGEKEFGSKRFQDLQPRTSLRFVSHICTYAKS